MRASHGDRKGEGNGEQKSAVHGTSGERDLARDRDERTRPGPDELRWNCLPIYKYTASMGQ